MQTKRLWLLTLTALVVSFLLLPSAYAEQAKTQSKRPTPAQFIASAQTQIGVTTSYDPSYQKLAYPNGDVPLNRGVCTDVVVRAYRGVGIDLQRLVHEDMKANWKLYPKLWQLKKPDPNIDHRRVPNLQVYFKRFGSSLKPTENAGDYLPGDLVTWRLPSGVPHIGIVSDQKSWWSGNPKIIHNIGLGTQLDDMLFMFTITGHYRFALQ
jgi:uncharacterized protein